MQHVVVLACKRRGLAGHITFPRSLHWRRVG